MKYQVNLCRGAIGRAVRASGALAVAASLLLSPRPVDARGIARPAVLASYSFDDDVATGPDTFAIWQGARHSKGGRGHVRLSSAFHLSGHRSVELQDIAGDGDFPELQGYFPVRREGQLFFHFAFLALVTFATFAEQVSQCQTTQLTAAHHPATKQEA